MVEGLGPRFRLVLTLVNEGAAALGGLVVVLKYDPCMYWWVAEPGEGWGVSGWSSSRWR
jgi:hypothetical protein